MTFIALLILQKNINIYHRRFLFSMNIDVKVINMESQICVRMSITKKNSFTPIQNNVVLYKNADLECRHIRIHTKEKPADITILPFYHRNNPTKLPS